VPTYRETVRRLDLDVSAVELRGKTLRWATKNEQWHVELGLASSIEEEGN
jgi:hypothetical protein